MVIHPFVSTVDCPLTAWQEEKNAAYGIWLLNKVEIYFGIWKFTYMKPKPHNKTANVNRYVWEFFYLT